MDNSVVLNFMEHLQEKRSVYFRLYNALYIVSLDQEKISIHQDGMTISYTYPTLEELFNRYIVYGIPLIDSFSDIKIV